MTYYRLPTSLLFVLLGLFWGGSFLLIKICLTGMNPAQVGALRLALGAVTLGVVMVLSRRRWPHEGRVWMHSGIVAIFMFVLPVALYSWAGQTLPSSLSAVLNASTPLMALAAWTVAFRTERMSKTQLIGVVAGAAGVVIMLEPWNTAVINGSGGGGSGVSLGGARFWLSVLACLAATFCYGVAYSWIRRYLTPVTTVTSDAKYDPVALTAVQLVIASPVTLVCAPWSGLFDSPIRLDGSVAVSMLVLGTLCTGIGYMWNLSITSDWGPVRAAQVTYITPIVGILLGWVLLGEAIAWPMVVGTAITLAGIALTRRGAVSG